jgi:hypothetical protein
MTKFYISIFLISILAFAVCTHLLLKTSISQHFLFTAFISLILLLAIIFTFYAYFKYSRIKYSNFGEGEYKNKPHRS